MNVILEKTLQHLFLSIGALALAFCFAFPLGFFLTRLKSKRLAKNIVRAVSLIQTLPGLAVIASIVVLLAAIPEKYHIPSTGYLPGILGLSLYAISPILTNVYAGISGVSRSIVEVGLGLGMSSRQTLFLVEIPEAMPTLIAGVRISGVWTIGMATLTSLVGSGGLGDLIMQGLRSVQPSLVFAGTIPAIGLALLFELALSKLEK